MIEFHLGHAGGASARQVEANRRRFCAALGGRWTPASLRQIHSAMVYQTAHVGELQADNSQRDGAAGDKSLEYRPAGFRLPAPAGSEAKPLADATFGCGRLGPESSESSSGDAMVTAEPRILLSIRTADCLPVLLADVRLRVVAAVHAGWRGALARVIAKTVGEMRRIFGSAPKDLLAALGPAIGRCCYEVGDEVVEAYRARFVEGDSFFCRPHRDRDGGDLPSHYSLLFHTQAPPGRRRAHASLHLDLDAVAHAQLTAAGLSPSAIHHCGYCTSCRADLFFSYRRDGAQAGRMMAVIGVRR